MAEAVFVVGWALVRRPCEWGRARMEGQSDRLLARLWKAAHRARDLPLLCMAVVVTMALTARWAMTSSQPS